MANTFTQLYVQCVFAVQGRRSLILPDFEEEVYKYITGIVTNLGQKMIAINGMPDHIHIFLGMKPTISVSSLIDQIKANSSKFINEKGFLSAKFNWQTGYGAFSYAHSQIDQVAKYILNQKEHHKKKSFKEEYLEFLTKFAIEYDEKYLFEWILENYG